MHGHRVRAEWVVRLVLLVSFGAGAQVAAQDCPDIDRIAADAVVQEFVKALRASHSMESLRPKYLVQSCAQVFDDEIRLAPDLRKSLTCEESRALGDLSFEFSFMLMDVSMRSEKVPDLDNDDDFALKMMPKEIATKIAKQPLLRQVWHRDEKKQISSRVNLEEAMRQMREVVEMAHKYIAEHPETDGLAASRFAEIKAAFDTTGAQCSVANDPEYYRVPQGTPIMIAGESAFAFVLVRENGDWKILRISPDSM